MSNKFIIFIIGLSLLVLIDSSCESPQSLSKSALDRGREVYLAHCVSCHGAEGDGNQGFYPALAQRQINDAYTQRAIRLIVQGSGFEGGMKPIALSQAELSDVINYIQNSWGNQATVLSPDTLFNRIQTLNTL